MEMGSLPGKVEKDWVGLGLEGKTFEGPPVADSQGSFAGALLISLCHSRKGLGSVLRSAFGLLRASNLSRATTKDPQWCVARQTWTQFQCSNETSVSWQVVLEMR